MNGNELTTVLFIVLIIAMFYFVLIRPQRNRQRRMSELQRSLVPGQRVMTNAGLFATVSAIDDDAVVLEVAPGVNCRFVKQSVVQVVGPVDGEQTTERSAEPSA